MTLGDIEIDTELQRPLLSEENSAALMLFWVVGLVLLGLGVMVVPSDEQISMTVLGSLLLVISFIDLRTYRVPDLLTGAVFIIGGIYYFGARQAEIVDAVFGALFAFGLFWVIRWLYLRLKNIRALGMGDVKLAGALGLWVGVSGLPALLLIGSILGLVTAIIAKRSVVPFGPFLCLGAWIVSISPRIVSFVSI